MEEKKNIDELFRSVIEPVEMTPPAQMWNSLDADLARKQALIYKKKARRFQILSIALILLLASFVTYYYMDLPGKTPVGNNPDKKELSYNNQKNIPDAVQEKQASTSHAASKPQDKQDVRMNPVVAEKKITPGSIHSQNKPVNRKRDLLALAQPVERNTTHVRKNSDHHLTSTVQANVPTKTTVEKNDGDPIAELPHPVSSERNEDAIASPLEITSGDEGVSANMPAGSSPEEKINELIPGSTIDSAQATPPTNFLSPLGKNIFSRLSVSAFYSPDYRKNFLKDTDLHDRESPDEYENREKSSYSFTTGILFRYDLDNRWSISSGASYSAVAYTMTFSTVYVGYGLDDNLHYQYPTSWGTVEIPNSGTRVLHDGDSVKIKVECSQWLKFVSVPLTVQYQRAINKFTWYVNAGVTANFMLREELKMNFATKTMYLENNVDGLKKLNFGYLIGFGLQYNFYKRFGIFTEPVLRGSITSLTENTGIDCYPYSFGLNSGVTYHF